MSIEDFEAKWLRCKRCPNLLEERHNVVLYRGHTNCPDVLFLGEAPGKVEDAFGVPFKGPAGRLLNKLILETLPEDRTMTYVITNIVCCLPLDADGKIRQPTSEEAENCSDRLFEFYERCLPSSVVLLGEVAKKYWNAHLAKRVGFPLPIIHVYHPAYLLRQGESAGTVGFHTLAGKATVLKLRRFFKENF